MRGKSIVALCLSFLLIFSFFSTSWVIAQDSAVVLAYEEEAAFLKSIKVIDSGFPLSLEITKAEAVKIIAKLLHPDLDFSKTGDFQLALFQDVPPTNPYYAYIKACADLKIIQGDAQGNFYPNQKITLSHLLTMVVNALGYTQYAIAQGGYPTGYFSVANTIGLTKGISAYSEEPIIGAVVAKVIYNALFADLIEVTSIANQEFSFNVNNEENLLTARLGITEYDAFLVHDGIISLNESVSSQDRLIFSDVKTKETFPVYSNGKDLSSYIGSRMRIFVRNNRETGRNELIYSTLHKKVQQKVISADSVITIADSYLEYEPEKDSGRFVKINFGSFHPQIIYNGSMDVTYELKNLLPKDGFITVTDNNGDGQYELVNVLSFNYSNGNYQAPARNIVVDTINASETGLVINCKFNPAGSLDLDFSRDQIVFTNFSTIKKVEDISEFDVISISESPVDQNGKSLYYLTAVDTWQEGTIESIVQDGLISNGVEYKLSSSITSIKASYLDNIPFNEKVMLQFDATGKIVYVFSNSIKTKNYAYLISAGIKSEADQVLQVKLFTKEGTQEILQLAEKVKIDGEDYATAQDQYAAILKRHEKANRFMADKSIRRPLIYQVNKNGQISMIDTDNPNPDIKNPTYTNHYATQTLLPYSDQDVENQDSLKAGYRSGRFINLKKAGTSLLGKFYINNTSVVMAVPDIESSGIGNVNAIKVSTGNAIQPSYSMVKNYEYPDQSQFYRILSSGDLSTNMFYDIQGYNIDPDTGVAGLVVLRGRLDSYGYGNVPYAPSFPLYVFLKKTQYYDEAKGKSIEKIYYTKDGKEELFALVDREELLFLYDYIIYGCNKNDCAYPVENDIPPLKKGDFIRVIKNGDALSHIERIAKIQELYNRSLGRGLYPSTSTYPYSDSKAGLESIGYTNFTTPFDSRYYEAGLDSTYFLTTASAAAIKGSTLKTYIPINVGKAFISNIDLADPTTFTEEYLSLAGAAITVVEIDESGEINVKPGTTADIRPVSLTGSMDSASILVYKHTSYTTEYLFVVNGFENLK